MERPALYTAKGTHLAQDRPSSEQVLVGRRLAKQLLAYHNSRALVVALPPGGVPLGIEVAQLLHLPLTVLLVREIVVPAYPAIVAGALSEGGGLCLNRALLRLPGMTLASFWQQARRAQEELARLVRLYRAGQPLPALNRHAVIVVDDGVGNGLVQLAALEALHHAHAMRCVVATPYGQAEALERVGQHATSVVALERNAEEKLGTLGHWRQSLGDAEAAALLAQYQRRSSACQSRHDNAE